MAVRCRWAASLPGALGNDPAPVLLSCLPGEPPVSGCRSARNRLSGTRFRCRETAGSVRHGDQCPVVLRGLDLVDDRDREVGVGDGGALSSADGSRVSPVRYRPVRAAFSSRRTAGGASTTQSIAVSAARRASSSAACPREKSRASAGKPGVL
ncbi:hypothetical protein GCM10018952_45520 [Streptosporangium vulgare]